MPQKAHVTSLDALEAFRSNLIIYLSQARPALDEISADVTRTRTWLENDQRLHWESQMRRRTKELEQAQQALFSARIGAMSKSTVMEQLLVSRAKESLIQADEKLRTIKKWDREFDGRVQPLVKQIEKLHSVLTNDMVKAVTYLTQAIGTLAAYAEKHQPAQAPGVIASTMQPGPVPSAPPTATGEAAREDGTRAATGGTK
jgi:hypothetical protein